MRVPPAGAVQQVYNSRIDVQYLFSFLTPFFLLSYLPYSTGDGGPATLARLDRPYGLAFDKNSVNMYISDYGKNTVRRVNVLSGIIRSDQIIIHKITTR